MFKEAETKRETSSNEKPGVVPRCPPSRALGHYQREMQPATSAVASDEAEVMLSSCWAHSSSVSLRIIKGSLKTQLHGGEVTFRSWPSPSKKKKNLSSTPIHTQFLQSLRWISSPQMVTGDRTLFPEATGQRGTGKLCVPTWGRGGNWAPLRVARSFKNTIVHHKHTSQEGREDQGKVASSIS